jgi:hypothetical protein
LFNSNFNIKKFDLLFLVDLEFLFNLKLDKKFKEFLGLFFIYYNLSYLIIRCNFFVFFIFNIIKFFFIKIFLFRNKLLSLIIINLFFISNFIIFDK